MNLLTQIDLLASDPKLAEEAISEALCTGYLCLFLGAGIPMSAGKIAFPSWPDLVQQCCSLAGVPFDTTKAISNDYLRLQAEEVEATCLKSGRNFLELVEQALYKHLPGYDRQLLKLDLLSALGALAMTSIRGNASALVNYNFDDLLEWYLELHGFRIEVVTAYPTLIPKADTVVYHPHGFLPRLPKYGHKRSQELVFGKRSYERACSRDTPWNQFQRAQFGCNLALFVGMSGDDPHVEVLFGDTFDLINKQRIIGFMLLPEKAKSASKDGNNLRRGIVNYYYPNHDELPDVLLGFCQKAAAKP